MKNIIKRTRSWSLPTKLGLLLSLTGLLAAGGTYYIWIPHQTMIASSGSIQILGDNNTVNKLAYYVWANENDWKSTAATSSIPFSTSPDKYTTIRLTFDAVGSAIIPSIACLKLRTDTQVVAIVPYGPWIDDGSKLTQKGSYYTFCFNTASQRQLSVGIFAQEPFLGLNAQLSAGDNPSLGV